jgi:hypothetical protein
MSMMVRGNAEYIAPIENVMGGQTRNGPSSPPYWGHVPFDLRLLSYAAYNGKEGPLEVAVQQNLADLDGSVVTVPSHAYRIVTFDEDTAPVIPGATAGNIDGAGRFGIRVTGPVLGYDGGLCVVLEYQPVDPAHQGKDLYAMGGVLESNVSLPTPNGAFAPLAGYLREHVDYADSSGASFSDYFVTPYELDPTVRPSGDHLPLAGIPWVVPGTFSDFMLVLRDNPVGVHRFHFRKEGATVMTIETAPGTQRIWTASPALVTVQTGDRVCLIQEKVSGSGSIYGELFYAFKPSIGGEGPGLGAWGLGAGGLGTG